ncbi:MAG: YlxR family protein [Desulfovibrio sp.]|nr:YlxR family protein [Desulfovibrio sp.]
MRQEQNISEQKTVKEKGPVRMCVACRGRFAKNMLTRYVFSSQGNIVLDPKKIAPGRGIYLCSNPRCKEKFVKSRPGVRRRGSKHV